MHPRGTRTGARRATRTHTDARDSPAGQIEECALFRLNGSRGYARSTLQDRFCPQFRPRRRAPSDSRASGIPREGRVCFNEVALCISALEDCKFERS